MFTPNLSGGGFFSLICWQIILLSTISLSNANLTLYYSPGSAPCRAVLLLIRYLHIENEIRLEPMNLTAKEHLKPEFTNLNLQHTIPTLVDDDYVIWESRAIMIYLHEKFGKEESLYPRDIRLRGTINQRLFFDLGVLYQRFADAYYPLLFYGNPIDNAKLPRLKDAMNFLNEFLTPKKSIWVAGSDITLADISIAASVSTIEACQFGLDAYPRVEAWLRKLEKILPGYAEVNTPGVESYREKYRINMKRYRP